VASIQKSVCSPTRKWNLIFHFRRDFNKDFFVVVRIILRYNWKYNAQDYFKDEKGSWMMSWHRSQLSGKSG
jgi:hypothetical protein